MLVLDLHVIYPPHAFIVNPSYEFVCMNRLKIMIFKRALLKFSLSQGYGSLDIVKTALSLIEK